jgi:hypothetical protein
MTVFFVIQSVCGKPGCCAPEPPPPPLPARRAAWWRELAREAAGFAEPFRYGPYNYFFVAPRAHPRRGSIPVSFTEWLQLYR